MLQSTIWRKRNNQVVIPLVPFFQINYYPLSVRAERLREKIQFGFSVLLPRGNESVVQSAYTIKSTENQLKPTNTIEIFQQILFDHFYKYCYEINIHFILRNITAGVGQSAYTIKFTEIQLKSTKASSPQSNHSLVSDLSACDQF